MATNRPLVEKPVLPAFATAMLPSVGYAKGCVVVAGSASKAVPVVGSDAHSRAGILVKASTMFGIVPPELFTLLLQLLLELWS